MKLIIHSESGLRRPPFNIVVVGIPYGLRMKWQIQAKTSIPCSDQILSFNGKILGDGFVSGLSDGSVIHLRTRNPPPADQEMNIHMRMPAPLEDFDVQVNGNQTIEEIKRLVVQKMVQESTPMARNVILTTSLETGINLPNHQSFLECELLQPYELFVKIDEAGSSTAPAPAPAPAVDGKIDEAENISTAPAPGEGLPQSAVLDGKIDEAESSTASGEGLPQSVVNWISSADVYQAPGAQPSAGGPRMCYTLSMEDAINHVSTIGQLKLHIYNFLGHSTVNMIEIRDVESGSIMPDEVNINGLPNTTKFEVTVQFIELAS